MPLKEGVWLSWLERVVHIDEVSGSNPDTPTRNLDLGVFLELVGDKIG